jgi:uncharacterized protein
VNIEFDPEKDRLNRQKHGISLAEAARLDLESAALVRDDRRDYGEDRFRAYGLLNGRMHMLAFTMRGTNVRAISLRKASPTEVRRYG